MLQWLQKKQDTLLPPLLFLLVCVLAYGIQAAQMGFYLDDWIILDAYNIKGLQGLKEYAYYGNRPLVFWLWWIGFQICDSVPSYWQIWALLWRWLTVTITWMVCRRLWPTAGRQVVLASLLFAVYPLFKQQATALTYSFHWMTFFLWGLSIYWMILAAQRKERAALFLTGSLLAGAVQLFSQEFYIGLELLRPVILWLALQTNVPNWKARLKRTLLLWLPFLLVFLIYFVWRTALMPTPGADRNTPRILYGLFSTPLSTLAELITMVAQDIVQILMGVWYAAYQPDLFTLTPPANLYAWGAAGLAGAAVFVYFRWGPGKRLPEDANPEKAWYKSALPFGALAMLFGFLPGWMIGRHIYDLGGIYNDRFGLAAMFGAALLTVALIEMLLKTQLYRLALACLLVGLGTGQNFRFETTYRWSWEKQSKLYWQLKWRAPALEKPTNLYGEGSIASFIGGQVTSSAVNLMYGPVRDPQIMDFRYFDVTKVDVEQLAAQKEPQTYSLGYMDYLSPPGSNLVFSFEPEKLQCLWVLSAKDKTNPYISSALSEALPLASLEQVLSEGSPALRADIFGPEPAMTGAIPTRRLNWPPRQAVGMW